MSAGYNHGFTAKIEYILSILADYILSKIDIDR